LRKKESVVVDRTRPKGNKGETSKNEEHLPKKTRKGKGRPPSIQMIRQPKKKADTGRLTQMEKPVSRRKKVERNSRPPSEAKKRPAEDDQQTKQKETARGRAY